MSELVGLDLPDVDLSRGLLFVRQGKGRKDRVVPLGKIACRFIERYVRTASVPAPSHARALFLNDVGQRLSMSALGNVILPHALLRARIKKNVTPHVLRHSCAVHLLENGASVRYVQVLLGHARLHTTQVYLVVVPVKLKAVHRASHPAEHQSNPAPTEPTKWIPQRHFAKPRPEKPEEPER